MILILLRTFKKLKRNSSIYKMNQMTMKEKKKSPKRKNKSKSSRNLKVKNQRYKQEFKNPRLP